MLVDKAAFMSIGTFRKYAKLLCYCKPKVIGDKIYTSLKALQPLAILQMDVTIFKTIDNTKVYLHIAMDNFSRCILGYKCSLQYSAANTLEVLQNVYNKYDLKLIKNICVVTDDGCENKSCFDEYIAATDNLTHFIAQQDIVQSNSMIEAVNKRLKYDFLFTKALNDFAAVENCMIDAVAAYNNKPLLVLSGYSPNEVLQGAMPNSKRFAIDIANAALMRKNSNSSFSCCSK